MPNIFYDMLSNMASVGDSLSDAEFKQLIRNSTK